MVFWGDNGAGKTNLLDAIHYLSTGKSYFNYIDAQNIQHGEKYFMVEGELKRLEENDTVLIGQVRGRKKVIKKNQVAVPRMTEHYGRYPVVMVTPYDVDLITGGSETRRKFMDAAISQDDKAYMQLLSQYERALQQRNALLKDAEEIGRLNRELLGIYDQKLHETGSLIYEVRSRFIAEFLPYFREYVKAITQGREDVSLTYQSRLHEMPLLERLKKNLQRDLALQRTSSGIHKDDLEFTIGDHPLKKFGSQGQQKSYLLALKLAEFSYIKDRKGFPPLLLLDDLFDRLDRHRVRQLISLLFHLDYGQVFITDTSLARVEEYILPVAKEVDLYHVVKGSVAEQSAHI